jgi:hypothetical protein
MTIFNPWVLLGGLLALLGAFGAGYSSNDEGDKVRAAWVKANADAAEQNRIVVAAAKVAQDKLQDEADEARRIKDEADKMRDAQLSAALGELRKRPPRPTAQPGGVPATPGPGAEGGGCTGAGLYADDAVLLARKADLYQRIREQRDACYEAASRHRQALDELQKPSSKTP